jgi:hypothetical protein
LNPQAKADAEQCPDEIDAASRQPKEMLPGLLKSGPESYESSFERIEGKLTALLEYDVDLARWKATWIYMRCAASFIDSRARVPAWAVQRRALFP